MPLYDFECPNCKVKEESFVPSDIVVLPCEACGSLMERMPAAPAIQARGCPSYESKMGRSIREQNITKRKKQYHDRGKPLPDELQNM
jgi:putative FmdB family regulatory protein